MLQQHPEGTLLHLHIQPGASRTETAGRYNDSLKIRLQAPPVEGKANKALLAFLAKIFGTSRSRIVLLKGETSRKKTVLIKGIGLPEANAVLAPRLDP